MKTFLKVLGILIFLFISALFIVPIIFKDDIVNLVKKETNNAVNAKVDFGDFDLSLIRSFPDFHFSIKDIDVEGVEEFEGVKLANIKKLSLVVDIMSVIRGESINVKSINIESPYIETKVLANGKANYDIAKESDVIDEEVKEEDDDDDGSFKLELKSLIISNGRIIYNDATLPMMMDIQELNIDLSGDMTADVTTLDAKGSIEKFDLTFDGMRLMNEVEVFLDALVEMDLEKFKFTFNDNLIRANELPLSLDGWLAMPEDAIDMDLTFAAQETEFKHILSMIPAEFAKDLEGVKTSGTMALKGYAKGTYLDSIYPAFGIEMKIENGRFQYPDLPKSIDNIQLAASVESKTGDLDATVVDVSKFHLEMANNPFDFGFYLATPISDPFIRAAMKGRLILDNIRDIIPLEKGDQLAGIIEADFSLEGNLSTIENERYEDFKANGSLIAEKIHFESDSMDYPIDLKYAAFKFSPRFLALENMQLQLGKSDLQLDGRLENFIAYALKDKQTLNGELVINSRLLDINELAGIEAGEESEEVVKEDTSDDEPMEALILPNYIDFTMTAKVSKVIYDNIEMEAVEGIIALKEQKLSITNTGMNLLDGKVTLNGFYETTDALKPTYDFDMNVKDFDVQKTVNTYNTVEQLVPIAKHTEGNYSAKFQINGALNDKMDPIFESMFGKGVMQTKNISVVDYKPFVKIGKAIQYERLNPMELDNVDLSFTITEGKVFVDPFTNKIGKSTVTIAGSNSFDQTIDYTFSFAIPREEFGKAANQAVDGLLAKAAAKGINLDLADVINIDVQLVGPASDPAVKTDFKESTSKATDAIKDKAKEAFDKKKKELEDKAKREIEEKKQEAERKAREEVERQKQKAQEEIEKKKQEAKEEYERQKKEAERKAKENAKKKLEGLFD